MPGIGERTRRKEIDAVRRGAGLIAQPKTMRFYDTACNIARRREYPGISSLKIDDIHIGIICDVGLSYNAQ